MPRPARARHDTEDGVPSSPLVRVAERMVSQIETLVTEVEELRASNAELRRQVRDAVAMLEKGTTALGGRRGRGARQQQPAPPSGNGRRRGGQRGKGAKGRATPEAVTPDVVRAVIAKLGTATAAEVADEITRAGAPVSGRAVRFLAESAGATTIVGDDGRRRYRL